MATEHPPSCPVVRPGPGDAWCAADRPDRRGGGEAAPDALLRAIFETSPDGLITIDRQGLILSFNRAAERMFGYRAEEVLNRNVRCLMPDGYAQEHDGYIRRYLRTGERRIIGIGREVAGLHRDGRVFPMELAVGEVWVAGEPIFAGFVRDISQRKAAEHKLHELQAELLHVSRLSAMGEMASALAHELNQPLTAIMNYAQAARRLHGAGADPEGRILGLLEKTVQQASRAGQIIHRLRQFLAKGETERTLEPVNLLVEEACALALVGSASHGVKVRYDLAPDLPPVLIDKIQMHQVITNLVRNSVDALSDWDVRGLTLSSRLTETGEVEVRVIDTGPGLDPTVAARLFEPFVTTKPGGMGIGLSICRSIVDAHGGRLWASANPGGGADFHIVLPVPAPERGGRRGA